MSLVLVTVSSCKNLDDLFSFRSTFLSLSPALTSELKRPTASRKKASLTLASPKSFRASEKLKRQEK